jgi:hypothetical protein
VNFIDNPYNIRFKSDGTPVIIYLDSCQMPGRELVKGGGWEDQIYKIASFENDYSALKKLKRLLIKHKIINSIGFHGYIL